MIAADAKARPSKRERRLAAKRTRERFLGARKAETSYARALRKIAAHVGDVVRAYAERGWVLEKLTELRETLERYAVVLEPWARAVAARMLAEVSRRDERAWFEASEELGLALRHEIRSAPTGRLTQELLAAEVELITSLPRKASERVQSLALKAVHSGARADVLSREIMRTGRVVKSRADLISRTETSRAQTNFTKARALYLGSEKFIWRTAKDATVRPSHRKLEGTIHSWNNPPVCEPTGERALPGCIWECRCWAEPIFTE